MISKITFGLAGNWAKTPQSRNLNHPWPNQTNWWSWVSPLNIREHVGGNRIGLPLATPPCLEVYYSDLVTMSRQALHNMMW